MIKIGHRMRDARLSQGFTIKKISRATKIREEFLEAIEAGEYKKLPSSAYAQGFVRNYAKFLGLDEKESLALFRREFDEDKVYEVLPKGFSHTPEFSINRLRMGRPIFLIFLILSSIVGFLLFQYRGAILNPPLKVIEPEEGKIVSDFSTEVVGKTDPNATLTIEGDDVAVDAEGNFRKKLTLFPGKRNITVKSINKFGRESTIERHIEVKQLY